MKKLSIPSILLLLVVTMSSCEAIQGIFKAGVYVGVFIVIAVIALIIFIVSKIFR